MGSALLNQIPRDEAETGTHEPVGPSSEVLRQQVAERLAAHRTRRARPQTDSAVQPPLAPPVRPLQGLQKSRIAATVAERYAQAQSYRAFLAAEAERALQQARAAAEIAARNAQAVAEARQQLLETLAREQDSEPRAFVAAEAQAESVGFAGASMLWPELAVSDVSLPSYEPGRDRVAHVAANPRSQRPGKRETPAPPAAMLPDSVSGKHAGPEQGGLRVVLYEELPSKPPLRGTGAPACSAADQLAQSERLARQPWDDAEAQALDAEIWFRQAPVFEEPAGPPMPLAANLIEFPRQLIASRKARPRYAEGPLRQETGAAPEPGQLRIFEVDSAQISTQPESAEPVEAALAQWTSIWLDTPSGRGSDANAAEAVATHVHSNDAGDALAYMAPPARPQTAALSRRVLSAAIDGAIVGAAALLSGAGFAAITGHLADPDAAWSVRTLLDGTAAAVQGVPLVSGLVTAALSIGCLAVAYQLLFFMFSESTPGMRLTRIGLCTFSDENPTRRAMQLRVLALVLSTVTLGLGHLWALLDEDGLTWQDLISRMYPRSY